MMAPHDIPGLARLLWQEGLLPLAPGMRVVRPGEWDSATGNFTGAEVHVDTAVYRGSVLFTSNVRETQPGAILRVVADRAATAIVSPDAEILQLPAAAPERFQRLYARMRSGCAECGGFISRMDATKRLHFFTRLVDERMARKAADMLALWEEGQRDWNYPLYMGLFAYVGGPALKNAYLKTARAVPYKALAHERDSRQAVEAMLLGGAGLLQSREDDAYIVRLKKDFDYLCHKWGIQPVDPSVWRTEEAGGYVSPVLRLVQTGGFLATREFIFDSVRSCRSPQDVYALFRAEIPDYWAHVFSSSRQNWSACTIGRDKMDVLAINLVAPLMVAYASVTGDAALAEAAYDLLCKVGPENNKITKQWKAAHVELPSAADSQAVIELNNEYCLKAKCPACLIGRKLVKQI